MTNRNPFTLLRRREIIEILDGDKELGKYEFIDTKDSAKVRMPYLSGPNICELSNELGLMQEYDGRCRWQYFESLFDFCIAQECCPELLARLFSKPHFSKLLGGHTPEAAADAYLHFVDAAISKINGLLYFDNHELVLAGGQYAVKSLNAALEIEAPALRTVNREYIRELYAKAINDIKRGDYDSSVTKSRTLLEETFIYAIAMKGEEPQAKGNITNLFGQVKNLYNMHADKNTDRRINDLVNGLGKIVSAVTEMRNANSDSHGLGTRRVAIEEHHARLVANAAVTAAEFVLDVANRANEV